MNDSNFIIDNKRKKGSFQHKVFKFVILVIVAVFFYLIFSFIRIEFFKSTNIDYKFELNTDKYNYLDKEDKAFIYSFDNQNIDHCNLQSFYADHVSEYKPCFMKPSKNKELENYLSKIKAILKEEKLDELIKLKTEGNSINMQGVINKIGIMNFAEVLDFSSLFMRYESKDAEAIVGSKAVARNKDYVFLQLEGQREFRIAPITQINKLKPKRDSVNENSINNFNELEATEDLFNLSNSNANDKPIVLKTLLKEGEMIYIPAYFFIQEKHIKGDEVSLKFEYNSNSRILNVMFKILFDDNIKFNIDDPDN